MAIANFTPLPTLPTPPNTQTDTKPIFLQKADAFNPALKGWADNFNSGTVPTLNDLIALLNQQLPYINTVADSDKAIRAIYADLSSIISVSEGIDSVQTVAEQISGVKDIADNLTEVLAAKGYAEDAKKWALIAESVANIGPATPEKIGLVKPDAVTTHITEDGTITVKNVAIGGNLEDLASARGQIGNYKTVFATGDDLNDVITSGTYAVSPGCANVPMNGPSDYYVLEVLRDESNANGVTQFIHSKVNTAGPTWSRRRISDGTWQPWQQRVQTNYIGDGIKISRSKALADGTGGLCIISVPEMQGATISAAGTSGLVPPAAAGQQESFLTGGGEYKPALTKISDSVNLADSKMAASAKAVKTAYDLAADAKQKSNTSGTADYANGLRGIPLQWVGRGASPEFLLGRLGQEPFDAFRPMHIEGVGSAKAWKAQNSGGNYVLYDEILGENPTYIMGYALNGIFKIYTTSALSVNYANSAGSAPANGGTSWATAVMPNVAFVGRDGAIPNGGTWLYIYMPYDSHYLRGVTLAGGATAPSNDGGIAIRVA